MTKKNDLTAIIDDKYIPLDNKIKLGIFIGLMVLPTLVFWFALFQPGKKTIEQLEAKKATLNKEVDELKAKIADRPKFLKELEDTEKKFAETSKLLPEEKEIPSLLTNISDLGRRAGLNFLSFKPKGSIPKDFYTEIPVSIKVDGPYHNVGLFFNKVSKLDRIVSVTSVNMANPKKDGPDMILSSNCELKTYRFTNVQVNKPATGKKK